MNQASESTLDLDRCVILMLFVVLLLVVLSIFLFFCAAVFLFLYDTAAPFYNLYCTHVNFNRMTFIKGKDFKKANRLLSFPCTVFCIHVMYILSFIHCAK